MNNSENENTIFENIDNFQEYYLIKDNNVYKFIITKLKANVLIKCKNYRINLDSDNFSIPSNKIDLIYEYVINAFEENKVIIKDIIINKSIKLKIKNYNNMKEVEIILVYNKNNNDNFIMESIINYNKIKNELEYLKDEIYILRKDVDKLKSLNSKLNKNDFNKSNNENFSDPQNIQFSDNLINDSYGELVIDNSFDVFKSINDILYIIYSTKNGTIISYNFNNNKKINEIKKAHNSFISNIRHYLDKINNRDLILSISCYDNNLKIWNILNFECLVNFHNVNYKGYLYSAYFLEDNQELYIITSNCNNDESIKIYDFEENIIKELNDSNNNTVLIINYYDNKYYKNYIIAGNIGSVISYDYNKNKIYHEYDDNYDYSNSNRHYSVVINENNEKMRLIESCDDGNIRIWDFHSAKLLKKINFGDKVLFNICLWNNNYLFIGGFKSIRLVDLNNEKTIKKLINNYSEVINLKKIIHPTYIYYFIINNIYLTQLE